MDVFNFILKDPIVNLCTLRGCDQSSTCFQHKSLPDLHRPPSYSSAESSVSRWVGRIYVILKEWNSMLTPTQTFCLLFSFDVKCDGDSRSAYSSFTQPDCHIHLYCEPEKCKYRVQSLRGSNTNEFQFSSRLYSKLKCFTKWVNVMDFPLTSTHIWEQGELFWIK